MSKPGHNIYEWMTGFAVCALPPNDPDSYMLTLQVEWRGDDRWAVCWLGYCLDKDGNQEYESLPSSRTDEWKARFRFSHDEAMAIAREQCGKIEVNGTTVADLLERRRRREESS